MCGVPFIRRLFCGGFSMIAKCPKCDFFKEMADNAIGRRATCPKCGEQFVITAEPEPTVGPKQADGQGKPGMGFLEVWMWLLGVVAMVFGGLVASQIAEVDGMMAAACLLGGVFSGSWCFFAAGVLGYLRKNLAEKEKGNH